MIRGEKRPVTKADLNIQAAIHNRFDIEVRDARTGELKQKAQAFNVICDALWTRLFGGNTYFSYILYGEGTGTPSASDTVLFTRINGLSAGSEVSSVDSSTGVYSLRKQATIDETTSVGKTITEIGIGYDSTHIVTHAMLQDMNGNPISIEKTDTDIITFYATVFVHWNTSGYSNGKIFVYAATYGLNPFLAGNSSYSTFNVYPAHSGWVEVATKSVSITKTLATKTLSFSGLRLSVGEANSTIYQFIIGFGYAKSIYVDRTAFPASIFSISGEAVGTGDGATTGFNTHFPIASNCKVYVDGVEQVSGVTITPKVIPSTNGNIVGRGFVVLDSVGYPRSSITADFAGTGRTLIGYFKNPNHLDVKKIVYTGQAGYDSGGVNYWLYGSNDFVNWTLIKNDSFWATYGRRFSGVIDLGQAYNYEYFRYEGSTSASNYSDTYTALDFTSGVQEYGIVFDTPPAAGAVITADYVADCIPKDSDHVFDLGMTITVGEYSGV